MRDDRLRLADILEAIGQIEKYSARGRAAFDEDELIRVWVLHHFEIIGEACRGLSEAFRNAHADEIWSDAVSFRNVLVHQYFGLDLEAVWEVVVRDLPELKTKVVEIVGTADVADDALGQRGASHPNYSIWPSRIRIFTSAMAAASALWVAITTAAPNSSAARRMSLST